MYKTSCICTVLKDEQEYLDEWISYHLDLGIDHMFIYEDIGSGSHKSICDKYGDKVSLDSIANVFEGGVEEINELRNTNRYYQKYFFTHIIRHIIDTYPHMYDYCFAIDNDEFITFEREDDTLQHILSIYEGYDAFMLQWKCYGANGHIYKPNYDGKGLIGTYVNEAEGKLTNSDIGFTKTCYDLNTFDESFFWNVHQPSDKCKWCKSDLWAFRMRPIYANVYLRHYITKSWEEYVHKIKVRGDILEGNRTYKDFFDLNTDLADRKEELIELAEKMFS